MLDQSFSADNFKTIFEIENRKGTLDKKFFSLEYYEFAQQLINKRAEIKAYPIHDVNDSGYKKLLDDRDELIEKKEFTLYSNLIEYSEKVNQDAFSIQLIQFKIDESDSDEKVKYKIQKNNAPLFFAMKQLQHNINRTFDIKQSNRYLIVEQIKSVLQDNLPKYIVRTDIQGFYENVPQERLLKLINDNQLLSPKSKLFIENIIFQYNTLTKQLKKKKGERKGIPRGAGVSAFLAELYMKEIDKKIKNIDDIAYYCRYVDDMFAVFKPISSKDSLDHYLNKIDKIVTDYGLALKKDPDPLINKTFECNLFEAVFTHPINFLGYKFIVSKEYKDGKLCKEFNVKLSDNRKDSYKRKIDAVLNEFVKDRIRNYKSAHKLLIHRLNYLTKNTKLEHPKKGLIGIYYSNSLLDKDCQCLKDLNSTLAKRIDAIIIDEPLRSRLKRFDFVKGFKEKLFFNMKANFNPKKKCRKGHKDIPDLRTDAEKEKRLFNNFEKITSAWK
ncbi:MAG: RNA-directed DNA polymerase [Paludibacter sp.]|nr:RNA-directed DNA polymerase [Paludibacter sp.]